MLGSMKTYHKRTMRNDGVLLARMMLEAPRIFRCK